MTLSVVISGRNDNHNGDFDLRAEYAVRHNAALLVGAGIDYEFVWVEWNPLPDRPFFGDKVRQWVKNFRGYVVPPEVHNHLCDNPSIGVMQFHAKNVGIRRANGEWVLSMNADTYLTEKVVAKLSSDTLDQRKFYLATRVDFAGAALRVPPVAYPIRDLESRPVTMISEVRIPASFGSAGDFTLIQREQFWKMGGHYEGIRFSNHHLDTLLCRQWIHSGGQFENLGNIYHADHKDSWNNFAAGDDRRHHGGCDYNIRLISVPYSNPKTWGLADYVESAMPGGMKVLGPPPGLLVRKAPPEELIVPEELAAAVGFSDRFKRAVEELSAKKARVVIYGLGEHTRCSLLQGGLKDLNITGFIDDSDKTFSDIPFPRISWEQANAKGFDAILIGSPYWAGQLRERALLHCVKSAVYPIKAGL